MMDNLKKEVFQCKNTIRDMNLRIKELHAVQTLIERGHDVSSLSDLISSRMDFCNKQIIEAKTRETELTGKKHKL